MMRVAPGGWPDLHGFGELVRGFEVRDEEHKNTMNTVGKIDTNTRTHAFRLLPRARITYPNPIKPQARHNW